MDGVLYNKNKNTLISYPAGKPEISFIIPNSVAYIGDYAFFGCSSLSEIIIPNYVSSIGNSAFHGCSSLTIKVIGYTSRPSNWDIAWNYSNRPVIWDYQG